MASAKRVSSNRSIGIVGAGVLGLTIAQTLAEDGHSVTVVARSLPGHRGTDWASPWAAALIAPHPDAIMRPLQKRSILYWTKLAKANPEAGIKAKPVSTTEYYDDRDENAEVWYREIFPDFTPLPAKELAPGAKMGYRYTTLGVDPVVFLPWIYAKLRKAGVRFIRRGISDLDELKQMTGAEILINASGVGARTIASDSAVVPVRGQTMYLANANPNRDLESAFLFQGSEYTYVIPRVASGGFILGGVSSPDDLRTGVDESLRADILRRVNRMTNGRFNWVDLERDVTADIVGFRPGRREGIRFEREGNTIHAYGVGGLGYVYAYGIALTVRDWVSRRPSESRL